MGQLSGRLYALHSGLEWMAERHRMYHGEYPDWLLHPVTFEYKPAEATVQWLAEQKIKVYAHPRVLGGWRAGNGELPEGTIEEEP